MSEDKRVREAEEDDVVKRQKVESDTTNANAAVNSTTTAVEKVQEMDEQTVNEPTMDEQAIDPVFNTETSGESEKIQEEVQSEHDTKQDQAVPDDTPSEGANETNKPADLESPIKPQTKTTPVSIKANSTDPDEIQRIKKLNHKEVERRRRENINNSIRELQELVPTTHTNKSQIIKKASEFIKKLKEKEETLINKWTLEKIITDQAISELATSNEKLKIELEKAYREAEFRKNKLNALVDLLSKQSNTPEVVEFVDKLSNDLFDEIDEEDHEEHDEEHDEDQEEQEQEQEHEHDQEQHREQDDMVDPEIHQHDEQQVEHEERVEVNKEKGEEEEENSESLQK